MEPIRMYTAETISGQRYNFMYFCGMISTLVNNDMLDERERQIAAQMLSENSSEPLEIFEREQREARP